MGASRKLQREALKRQYQRFCEAWANEKRYQAYAAENSIPLGEGVQQLGRKPTFAMWLAAMKNKKQAEAEQAAQQAAQPDPKKIEVTNTEW